MSYNHVNVSLTPGQIKKLGSKEAMRVGATITLKPANMSAGSNKLSLTKTQLTHFNKARAAGKGVQLKFSKAAISNMIKSGGFLPFLIPAIAALATGALSGAAGWGTKKILDKVTGGAIKRKKRGPD